MSALARYLARFAWWWMLWLMRRPWMKRLQRRWLGMVRESKRQKAWESVVRQNRLARRYGLALLTLSFNILIASMAITVTYYVVIALYVGGYLNPPEGVRVER